jgi:hypothetical protein
MSRSPLKNIPIKTFRDYLKWKGLEHLRTTGGHEIWGKKGLKRPVVFQTHENPVPERVVRVIFRVLNETAADYIEFLKLS